MNYLFGNSWILVRFNLVTCRLLGQLCVMHLETYTSGIFCPQFHHKLKYDFVIVSWNTKCVLQHSTTISLQIKVCFCANIIICELTFLNRWKCDGLSFSFLPLVGMVVVQSSCLKKCIHLYFSIMLTKCSL
jgi:hypothetical protein